MPVLKCPRCNAINFSATVGGACEACGAKLPAPDAIAPQPADDRRDEYSDDYPGGSRYGRDAGRHYPDIRKVDDDRSEARRKAANEVSGMLFAIAVLTLICNAIGIFAL